MAAQNPPPAFFGTQARILITEWHALAKVIVAHSTPAKEKRITNLEELESFDIENLENLTFSTADELPNILAEKNIQTALKGPFGGFIKEKLTAYSRIARFRLEIHLSKEELFKNKRVTLPEAQSIPLKKLEKLNFSQLDQIQNDLGTLTEAHDQEWQEFLQQWLEKLIQFFAKTNVLLTEREIKELRDEDIVTELLPRFVEIGIKLPQKTYPSMSFTEYLNLKALLTTQSALSRQHLPHGESEIQQKLQNFQSEFTQMQNQEQQLLEDQKNSTWATLSILE